VTDPARIWPPPTPTGYIAKTGENAGIGPRIGDRWWSDPPVPKSAGAQIRLPPPQIASGERSLPRPSPEGFGHLRHRAGTTRKPGKRPLNPRARPAVRSSTGLLQAEASCTDCGSGKYGVATGQSLSFVVSRVTFCTACSKQSRLWDQLCLNIITTHFLYYSESIIHVRYQDDDVTDKRKNIRSRDVT
jgi:hypothetical protein